MPEFVDKALRANNVYGDYKSRPQYQQNDYLMWINSAKQPKTKKKRLDQMVQELRVGGVYMKMKHPASYKD